MTPLRILPAEDIDFASTASQQIPVSGAGKAGDDCLNGAAASPSSSQGGEETKEVSYAGGTGVVANRKPLNHSNVMDEDLSKTRMGYVKSGAPPAGSVNLGRPPATPAVSLTSDVSRLLSEDCAVAIGVSGGKDSAACALAVSRYLSEIGHVGPKLLIHADLGRTEWKDSLPSCERLADKIGWELAVVRRKSGDMLARWHQRWADNLSRYANLECVKLILPWSTPAMRFCTSELKTAIIAAELKKRFRKSHILNVTGIRRQESTARSKKSIAEPMKKLERDGWEGITWNAIIDQQIEQVFRCIADAGLKLHEAYTVYGSTRVSCAFCILASEHDLTAASRCTDNQELYREMVALEASSTFAFQGNRWLADIAPGLLSTELQQQIKIAKEKAAIREAIESEIPEHLLYVKGWPNVMPTPSEADLIASVRRRVSALIGCDAQYLTGDSVSIRYAELMAMKAGAA